MNRKKPFENPRKQQRVKVETGKYYGLDLGLDRKRMALLVIDLQNDFLHPEGVSAKYGVAVSGFEKSLTYAVKLSDLCRKWEIPIIHVKHVIVQDKKGKGVNVGMFASTARPWFLHEGLRPGTWGAEMVTELGRPDYEINKQRLSGFFETPLESLLRNLEVEILVLSGFSTNLCVEHTFRDAVVRDFGAVGIREAMIAHDPELQKASEKNMAIMGFCLNLRQFEAALYAGEKGKDQERMNVVR